MDDRIGTCGLLEKDPIMIDTAISGRILGYFVYFRNTREWGIESKQKSNMCYHHGPLNQLGLPDV